MRHGKKFNHLSRKRGHRKAMLSNMACSLIEHKRINTTLAKAKALRVYVEPLITKSKDDTTHSRRTAFRYLRDKTAVNELFREIAPKIAERPGGYTRIIRLGNRLGDNAEMCMIELVDFNELLLNTDGDAKKTRRSRRGRGGKSKSSDSGAQASSDASQKGDDAAVDVKTEETEEKKAEEAPKTEAKKEAPKAETPKAEKKEEAPKAETKEETPKAEKKEETPKAESKEETPKAEDKSEKEEAPKKDAEPKAEKKADDSKKDDADEASEEKKEDK